MLTGGYRREALLESFGIAAGFPDFPFVGWCGALCVSSCFAVTFRIFVVLKGWVRGEGQKKEKKKQAGKEPEKERKKEKERN